MDTLTEVPYLEYKAYLRPEFEDVFVRNARLAMWYAGGITVAELVRALKTHVDESWTRDKLNSVIARSDRSATRSRIALDKAEDLVRVFDEGFGLRYKHSGRPIDLDWFTKDDPPKLTRDLPGYLTDLTLAA